MFRLFAFGVPPLKTFNYLASSVSGTHGTHGTPCFRYLCISVPPRPFLRREPSARADATARSRSADLLSPIPPTRRSRSVRLYGFSLRGPLRGLSDSRIPSGYSVSLGVRLYLVEQSRQLGYCHKAILQAVHCEEFANNREAI